MDVECGCRIHLYDSYNISIFQIKPGGRVPESYYFRRVRVSLSSFNDATVAKSSVLSIPMGHVRVGSHIR